MEEAEIGLRRRANVAFGSFASTWHVGNMSAYGVISEIPVVQCAG
jgi:hypothetical protein